jgi:hypothetical protein
MKKINFILIVILIYTLACCQNQGKNKTYKESEEIYKSAIEIHDEIMPMMGEIMKLQSALKSKKEGISDDESFEKINIVLQKLENAHNSMMHWMRNITPIPDISDNDSDLSTYPSEDEMLKIQQKSLESIKEVKAAILTSIEEANTLLSAL